MLSVLLARIVEDEQVEALDARFAGRARFERLPQSGEVPADATDAEVLFRCAMSKSEFSRAIAESPSLRWVHTCSAGFDQLLVPEITDRGLLVTRSAATHHIPISEWVIGYMFMMAKRFPDLMRAQSDHVWAPPETTELGGATVGIVGAGAIGGQVARRARALGMRVIATKREPEPLPDYDEVMPGVELARLLAESDYVVLACPLTSETRDMIGERELRTMKPTAYLLNIARGGLIVDEELVRALNEGWIAGACLDAFRQEPLPAESPLWDVPNLFITPHASYKSPRFLERSTAEFAGNLERYLAGEPLHNTLRDAALGY
ncbi:MAG TPA: D-2-hydroxyacid dehydrogenase [Candidatus Limnocylindria bacterium]|nr:D-2-hydroxyacid dehydrogenase [Candidatus Limnocylindria bacterium]